MVHKLKFFAMIFHFICSRYLKTPFLVPGLRWCFLMSATLSLLGIWYLAWASICIWGCTIPVTSHFKGVTVRVCAVCCWACSFYCCPGRNELFLTKGLSHWASEMPLYSGPPFFPYQWEFLCLPSPVADVEIIEDTLLSLSLSLTWVWIRSSSLDSHGCLIYWKCPRWFKKCSCYLRDTKCINLCKILPSWDEAWGSAVCSFVHSSQQRFSYLPPTHKSGIFS